MRRAFFVCLLTSLSCSSVPAQAGIQLNISVMGDLANVLQLSKDERREPPRRLRELRLKEAIRRGDLSPDEARDWRRNQRMHQERDATRPSDERGSKAGRSHWRDTQRRVLERDDR